MLIIKVDDNRNVSIQAEGKTQEINADLVIGIRAYYDSMVKHEDNILMKAVAHGAVLKALEIAYDILND